MSSSQEPSADPTGYRSSVVGVLNALLSVTFLVLSAYIGWYSTLLAGRDSMELRYFAILVGAYGIWRMVRSVIRARGEQS